MIDGTKLTFFVKKRLSELPYQQKVEIYDSNCDGCPFALIQIKRIRKVVGTYRNIDDAVTDFVGLTDSNNYRIYRGCNFGDQVFTLEEIITNTCRFWKSETCEGGDDNEYNPSFIEIDEEEMIKGNIIGHSTGL